MAPILLRVLKRVINLPMQQQLSPIKSYCCAHRTSNELQIHKM